MKALTRVYTDHFSNALSRPSYIFDCLLLIYSFAFRFAF